MISLRKKQQPDSPNNLEMHLSGPPISLNMVATVAAGVVGMELSADVEDASDTVDTVDAVGPETALTVRAPIEKLKAILQMHAESRNAHRREEITMSAFVSSAVSQDMSKSIASPTNV
jgi:hypothetical protein